jgi:TRAP-type uncharacterized transport system substrate-binding protein
MSHWKRVIRMMLVLCLILTMTSTAWAASRTAITFGTMDAGTSTYAAGAALSAVWNNHLPDYTITQQPMQVTGPAFRLLKVDELDLAITTVWAIHGAYTGEDPSGTHGACKVSPLYRFSRFVQETICAMASSPRIRP